jgi:hypothetical protein
MKYPFWIHENRFEALQSYCGANIEVLKKEDDMVYVELTIKYDSDILDVFQAGVNHGMDLMAQTWREAI